jgi:hypothetical protein
MSRPRTYNKPQREWTTEEWEEYNRARMAIKLYDLMTELGFSEDTKRKIIEGEGGDAK